MPRPREEGTRASSPRAGRSNSAPRCRPLRPRGRRRPPRRAPSNRRRTYTARARACSTAGGRRTFPRLGIFSRRGRAASRFRYVRQGAGSRRRWQATPHPPSPRAPCNFSKPHRYTRRHIARRSRVFGSVSSSSPFSRGFSIVPLPRFFHYTIEKGGKVCNFSQKYRRFVQFRRKCVSPRARASRERALRHSR